MTPAAGSAVSVSCHAASSWGSPTLPVGEHSLDNDAGESASVLPRPSLPLLSLSLQRRIGPLEGPPPSYLTVTPPCWPQAARATSRRSRFPRRPPRTACGVAQRGHPRLPTRRHAAGHRPAVDPSPAGEVRASAQSRGKSGGGWDEGGRGTGRGAGRGSAGRSSGWHGEDVKPVEGRPGPGGGRSGRAGAVSNQRLCPVGAPRPPG